MEFRHRIALAVEPLVRFVFRRRVDYVLQLQVSVVVHDAESGTPLPGVVVFLEDVDVDRQRTSGSPRPQLLLGATDSGGQFSTKTNYLWSREVVFLGIPRHAGTLALRLERDAYEPSRQVCDTAALPTEGGIARVAFEKPLLLHRARGP